jgi:ADP-heptose:LPS heptosyltransferase
VNTPLQILVIRRDNIGDLICTTPLLHGLRRKYPDARISVLASSYNVDVLDGNPDVDETLVFLKKNQKSHGYGRLGMLWNRWRLLRTIRKRRFDHIILANGGWRYAHTLGGKQLLGFREPGEPDHHQPDVLAPDHNGFEEHEVSKMARLGIPLGIEETLGATKLFPDTALVVRASDRLKALGWNPDKPFVALHLSSRNPLQRWPEESFIKLAQALTASGDNQILLLWSPGAEDDAMHPGDDDKAERILTHLHSLPVFSCPTATIKELVAAVSLADQMICSDGGAMHIAAALNKPIVCFFGGTFLPEWHPWGVPYVALQKSSRSVADITVEETLAAFAELQTK